MCVDGKESILLDVYLEFNKVFDKVSHSLFIARLVRYGLVDDKGGGKLAGAQA